MTRAMAAGALVCALLLTSACGGDSSSSEGTPSPSPSSASPSASATPSAPALPEAAKKNTKAGAIAFVRYYVRVYNFAQSSGQIDALRSLSAPSCKSCANVEQAISKIYQEGGRFEGGVWKLNGMLADRGAGGTWLVTVGGHIADSKVVPATGQPRKAKGGKASADFHVRYSGQWRVLEWNRL